MQNIPQQPSGGSGAAQQSAKKGLSKGCIVGIVAAVVVVALAVIVVIAAAGGLYYFRRSASSSADPSEVRSSSVMRSGAPAASDAETPRPTSAQSAAVAGGQSVVWEQQEISWTVPQRWAEHEASSQSLLWRSPGTSDAASLIGTISPMGADFPADASINAFYQQAQNRKANGEVNEVRWLSLDGVRGVMFRESAPEDDDSPQRLQWLAYRKYKGQTQLVNIMLASRGKDFARHEDALHGILYSTKLTK